MKLKEIKGLFIIDYGAPSPRIISSDNELLVAFNVDKNSMGMECINSDDLFDTVVLGLKFSICLKYTFGIPGNETISGHPYYSLGLECCAFYEMENSDWIEQLKNIDRVHPSYNIEKWNNFKHYIITFHDNMFECVAKGYEVVENVHLFLNQDYFSQL